MKEETRKKSSTSEFDAEESVSVVENDKGSMSGTTSMRHYIDETQSVSDDKEPESEKHKQDVVEAINHKLRKEWKILALLQPHPEAIQIDDGKRSWQLPFNGGVTINRQ